MSKGEKKHDPNSKEVKDKMRELLALDLTKID
jgi:hypothetical protein